MRMTSSTMALLLLANSLPATATSPSLPLFPRAVAGDGFLSVPVASLQTSQDIASAAKRAANPVQVTLDNMAVFYAIEDITAASQCRNMLTYQYQTSAVGLGTPPQTVSLVIDTGSSELWVDPDCSTAKTSALARQCESLGQYDPKRSKTPPVGPFGREQLTYGDPSDRSTLTSVIIRYYLDNVSFGKAVIKNQTFGVVQSSQGQSQGLIGLAPDVHGGFGGTQPYSLLLNTMAEQGVIASRVFALDLRHSDSPNGAIIYGGIDRNKFVGSLAAQPLVRGTQGEFRLAVAVDSLGITQTKSSSFKLASGDTSFVLDSGSTLTRMHSAAAMPILKALGARDSGDGIYIVACETRNHGGTVDFDFGGKTVRVPFSDFILGGDGLQVDDWCPVGLVTTTDQQVLGDTVLRAGYFVFDWDNQQVHIAQAANCGDDDVVAVGTGKNAVPDVQGNCKDDGAGSPTSSATAAYTTVYTVTSCASMDSSCATGVLTTETVHPARPTAGGSSAKSGNAGGRLEASAYILNSFIFGILGAICNIWIR